MKREVQTKKIASLLKMQLRSGIADGANQADQSVLRLRRFLELERQRKSESLNGQAPFSLFCLTDCADVISEA